MRAANARGREGLAVDTAGVGIIAADARPFHQLVGGIGHGAAPHGVFVVTLFGQSTAGGSAEISPATLLISAVGLAISHLLSYRQNYIGRGEYLRVSPGAQMFSVYGRVVVLHLTVIIGGFAISSLDAPVAALVVMVLIKTAIDLGLHLREHRAAQPELTSPA